MKSVTRKLTRYSYFFGTIQQGDNGYSINVTDFYESYEKLGTRKIKELETQYNAQFVDVTETLVKAEVALETFIANANITEI